MGSKSLASMIREAVSRLDESGISSSRVEAEILAAHIAGVPRSELLSAALSGRELYFDAAAFDELIGERAQRIPLQHLTGTAPFRGLTLAVGPGVFIPRPETEQVTQAVIDIAHELVPSTGSSTNSGPLTIVDLCSGSGAIALALAAELPMPQIHGVELSDLAVAWAQHNRDRLTVSHGPAVTDRLTLHQGDAKTALPELAGAVDIVVSNPPYIPPDQVPIDPEVRDHDPEIALYGGGDDGLEVPRAVLNRAGELLRPGGVVIMEHAEVQADSLRRIAHANGQWENIESLPDLAGRPRMLRAYRTVDAVEVAE